MADDAVRRFASAEGAAESPAQPAATQPAESAPPRRPNIHERRRAAIQRRFGFAYFALAVASGIAIGLLIVLLGHSGSKHTQWSSFKPTSKGLEGAQQIAGYVSRRYRLGDNLFAAAFATTPVVQQTDIGAAAIRTGFSKERAQDVQFYRTDHAVMYQFSGAKEDGTIPGTPSVERGNLLRREILEMSLYSMKYLGNIDTVIAFPPPAVGADGKPVSRAVLLRKPDFKPLLKSPLSATLPQRPVLRVGDELTAPERAAIAKVRFMQYSFQALPNGDALLVLTPAA